MIWGLVGLRDFLRGASTPRGRFLFATAVIGASVAHQALHRKDGQHLLQVLIPLLVEI